MRAWQLDAFGPPRDVLHLVERSTPTLSPGECLVRIRALALNFPDMLLVEGKYQVRPELPATPGMEAMGQVVTATPGGRFQPGQRVLVNLVNGCFAQEVAVPDALLYDVPESMTDAQAAGFHLTYQTAYFALTHRSHLMPGETLLVHGAAGGVGTAAVQVGKALGAKVIATAGGSAKGEIARRCGADHVIDTQTQDFVAEVKRLTAGQGADVIFDPIGGETFDKSTKVIAFEGRLVVIGFASGTIPQVMVNRLLLKTASVVGLQWGAYKFLAPEKVEAAHRALCQLYLDGKLMPMVYGQIYRFDQLVEAMESLTQRQAYGKVVVDAVCA